jgi:hypothetical protein
LHVWLLHLLHVSRHKFAVDSILRCIIQHLICKIRCGHLRRSGIRQRWRSNSNLRSCLTASNNSLRSCSEAVADPVLNMTTSNLVSNTLSLLVTDPTDPTC